MTTLDELKEMDFEELYETFLDNDPLPHELLEDGTLELSDILFWLLGKDLSDEQMNYVAEQILEGLKDLDEQDWIVIDGEMIFVDKINEYGYLPMVEIGKLEYYVAESTEHAGRENKKYWEDMAENDQKEFIAIIGEETLLKWALGNSAGPSGASSLSDWLDIVADYPEENWAGYDGQEVEVQFSSQSLKDTLGFTPTVAYRWN